jgi:hypothetical protein
MFAKRIMRWKRQILTVPLHSGFAKLVDCPDCGNKVSASAPTCPNCGSPVQKKLAEKKAAIGCLVLLAPLIVIGSMAFFWNLNLTPEQKAALDKEQQDEDMAVMACTFTQKIVRSHLKAPATAEFPSCYGSSRDEYYVRANKDRDTFIVPGYVDAQNSFGAKIRTRYEAIMSRTGSADNPTWRETSFSFNGSAD